MAIKFQAIARKNPLQPNDPAKFYPSPVYTDKLTLRKISKEIAERTSLSGTDVMAVLEALTQVLPFFLIEGNIIYLGDFGTFRISLHCNGKDTAEALIASDITDFKLLFRPGKELSTQLKLIEAVKV